MAGAKPIPLTAILLALSACVQPAPDAVVFDGVTMGTTYTVKITPPLPVDRGLLARDIAALLDAVDARMSTYKTDSELSRLNADPSTGAVALSPDMTTIIAAALEVSRISDGAFDITVGPLVNLWGFGPGGRPRRVPDDAALAAARSRIGWQRLHIDTAARTLRRDVPGMYLDLSGIAQGFGADAVARYLERAGVRSFMVDVSGEIVARGTNPRGEPWRVGIERPVAERGVVERVLRLRDVAMATSGDYRNYFEERGVRYSHLIDPATGRPITHRLASVSVLGPYATRVDGLATALMLLGPARGYAVAMRERVPALFIMRTDTGFEERWTPFLEPYLEK
jgi:thiamine biosynthesis lipoprotein